MSLNSPRPGDVLTWNGMKVIVVDTDSEKLTRQQQIYGDRYQDARLVVVLSGQLVWVPLRECKW